MLESSMFMAWFLKIDAFKTYPNPKHKYRIKVYPTTQVPAGKHAIEENTTENIYIWQNSQKLWPDSQ